MFDECVFSLDKFSLPFFVVVLLFLGASVIPGCSSVGAADSPELQPPAEPRGRRPSGRPLIPPSARPQKPCSRPSPQACPRLPPAPRAGLRARRGGRPPGGPSTLAGGQCVSQRSPPRLCLPFAPTTPFAVCLLRKEREREGAFVVGFR